MLIKQATKKTLVMSISKILLCQVIAHDVIEIRRAQIMGERILTGALLCNGINAHHSLVCYLAYTNIQHYTTTTTK